MNKKSGVTFEIWWTEFTNVCVVAGFTAEAVKGLHEKDWRQHYDGNMTPAEAMLEDMSNA